MQLHLVLQALLVALVSSAPSPQFYTPGGESRTDITSRLPCTPNILLYARGSTERGNIGHAIGQSFISSISSLAPGRFLYQGIDYIANVPHLDPSIVAKRQLKEAVSWCPDAKVVFGGYSEGGRIWHRALGSTDVELGKIFGIITFGDPLQHQPFTGIDPVKIKQFCAQGDDVCHGGAPYPVVRPAHSMYAQSGDTGRGGEWVVGSAA